MFINGHGLSEQVQCRFMEKILIIDDNNDICLLLERFLSKQGYKTASVQRGEDGLVLLRKEAFELVICDFKLPDIDGLEMLRRIKVKIGRAHV